MRTKTHNSHSVTGTLLVMVVVAFTAIPARTATAVIVNIPDPGLEAAIRNALGIGPSEPIMDTDMAGLTTSLFADRRGITNLTGLEYCVNVPKLILGENRISDLGPLSGLTGLVRLDLYGNDISDLGPLSGLHHLVLLYLDRNRVSDLGPLSRLTCLKYLFLNSNCINDLDPLSELTNLDMLELSKNSVGDLGSLSGLAKLAVLDLRDNRISDLAPLSGLSNLRDLFLDDNNISDIWPLVDNIGMGTEDYVLLRSNPLSCKAITIDIPILQGRGVYVGFDPWATLHVDIAFETLNLKSQGNWITCRIDPGGCDPGNIVVDSIRLEDSLEVQQSVLAGGTLMVKFSRSELQAMLEPGETELTLTGQFTCGLQFVGTDTIRVIDPANESKANPKR